jgi:Pyruvate/2-oxoacid:ferredoxin oxidoreductase delta subunit
MSRPVWFVELLKKVFPTRKIAALLTNLPVIENIADFGFFMGDDIVYLPKDNTIQINEAIAESEDIVLPSQVVEHFIEIANYHWIMDFCLCRESEHCQDYPRDFGCIFLGEAVLGINPQLGRLVSKEEALDHAHHCREAGLVHLIGRNKLDTMWLGVKPGGKLMTICNCCPCCCLWGTLPYISPKISRKIHKLPGVTVTVTDLCSGCGVCTEGFCFVDAIAFTNGRAEIKDTCRGCGRCVEICPDGAISLTIDETTVFQKMVNHLSRLIDVT